MDLSKKAFGTQIESNALKWFLSRHRGRVLERNFRGKRGEIDLIFEETLSDGRSELVFVEVRARVRPSENHARLWVDGVQSVDRLKRSRIVGQAKRYLQKYQGSASGIRFDILAWDGKSWEYARDAW